MIQAATSREIEEVKRYQEELREINRIRRKRIAQQDLLRAVPPPPPFELLLHLDARSNLTYLEP